MNISYCTNWPEEKSSMTRNRRITVLIMSLGGTGITLFLVLSFFILPTFLYSDVLFTFEESASCVKYSPNTEELYSLNYQQITVRSLKNLTIIRNFIGNPGES